MIAQEMNWEKFTAWFFSVRVAWSNPILVANNPVLTHHR